MLKTYDLIAAAAGGPLDIDTMRRTDAPVSSKDGWNSPSWQFDVPTEARKAPRINFDLVPEGFQQEARYAAWSALVDPRGEHRPAIATVAEKMAKMDQVLSWLDRHNSSLADVDADLFECFLDDLEDAADAGLLNKKGSDEPSVRAVSGVLFPWTLLRDQAGSMRDACLDALTFDPFEHCTVEGLSLAISGDKRRKSPPLPDEIAVPIVEMAARMAGAPTDEIADALKQIFEVRKTHRPKPGTTMALPELRFSALEDGGPPWLEVPHSMTSVQHQQLIWQGVRKVVGAHITMIFACGVPRPGEILSASSGMDPVTGLPACIERTLSDSRLFDHYWMSAVREKQTDGEPEPDEWLVGCAVAGDSELPDAVKAVLGIQRILEPLRETALDERARDRLLVSAGASAPTRDGRLTRCMPYDTMRDWAFSFITDAVDWDGLPDTARDGTDLRPFKESRGKDVTARAWRKTLVQFMLRIDGRMALPLARRLRHKVHDVLNEAYQDTDPGLLEEVDDAMARTLARSLVGVASGERQMLGWLGELMATHLDEVRALTAGLDGEPAVAKVQAWARERNSDCSRPDPASAAYG